MEKNTQVDQFLLDKKFIMFIYPCITEIFKAFANACGKGHQTILVITINTG